LARLIDVKVAMEDQEFAGLVESAIKSFNAKKLVDIVTEGLAHGYHPAEILHKTLLPRLQEACEKIRAYDITFAELLLITYTIKPSLDLLIREVRSSCLENQPRGKIVIGTVKGDIHEFGKDVVAAIFESGGYGVVDLGKDVSPDEFTRAAMEEKADIIAASTMMTPTLVSMEELLKEIKARRLKIKTIIGGWATSSEFAERIGADAWAKDAIEGLERLNSLTKVNG
jgi:5-methyltetrahydrofolate--homocysteine methyltransferase